MLSIFRSEHVFSPSTFDFWPKKILVYMCTPVSCRPCFISMYETAEFSSLDQKIVIWKTVELLVPVRSSEVVYLHFSAELVGIKHRSDHGGGLLQPLLLGITSNTSKCMEASGQCSRSWSGACQAFPAQKICGYVCRNHKRSFESRRFWQGPCSPGIPCKRRGCSSAGHSFQEGGGG